MTQKGAGYEKESVIKFYIKHRPAIPKEIFQKIISFHDRGSSQDERRGLAVDVGCGSGQSTLPLAKHFKSVIGIDASEAQLKEAKKLCADHRNIVFRLGSAEKISCDIEMESVDLVTVGTALHWFDIEMFYKEALQILKPGGTLVAYYMNIPRWHDEVANDIIYHQIFRGIVERYWQPGIKHMDNNYSEAFALMRSHFVETARDESLKTECNFSIENVLGLLKSTPQYCYYKEDHPEHPDEVDEALKSLMSLYGIQSIEEKVFKGYSPLVLIMGRKMSSHHYKRNT